MYPKLEMLNIRIFENTLDVCPCDAVFESMPSLRHLSIEAPGVRCPISWGLKPTHLDKLQVLQLKNCHFLEHKGDDLVRDMRALEDFENLERVEFLDCPDILKWKKEIEEVFPKGKLHWSTERLKRHDW